MFKKFLFLSLAGILGVCISSTVFAHEKIDEVYEQIIGDNVIDKDEDNLVVGYDFPVKPGTEEWERLSYKERVRISQVPEKVLGKLSTEELVQTVLNYPFVANLFLFNTYEEGFKTLLSDFNGLTELVQREDAGQILLEKRVQLSNLKNDDSIFEAKIIDTILHQDEIFNKLSIDEKINLSHQDTAKNTLGTDKTSKDKLTQENKLKTSKYLLMYVKLFLFLRAYFC